MPLSQDDTTVQCALPTGLEWTDALTILKRAGAGATGIHLQKPSHEEKGEAWPVGNNAFSHSSVVVVVVVVLLLLGRSFLSSLSLLTCFALVRPSHLYLGVARQKKGR